MEPALDVLDRALRGDAGALSFLDRTASIYVLNYNAEGQHTTYGCWDFMNQALNEIERFENNAARAGYTVATQIEPHVQLLCKICQKAARRSRESDRRLISTCLFNAGIELNRIASAQSLVDANCQMRERVMGRLATSAFDFSYSHFQSSQSVFSSPTTIEHLCGVLAANVIAAGPTALKMFALEWLIPSATSMPTFSVVTIILHLGNEALSNTVPQGTNEMLRSLTPPLILQVATPILSEALRESDTAGADKTSMEGNDTPMINFNHRLSALTLRALERWCTVVNLRIKELEELSRTSEFKIIEIISDALYSNIEIIVDAVADLIDILLENHTQKFDNFESILKIDNQIHVENDECEDILSELASAIGLQRYRFIGRQSSGDVAACRCLTRIAATIACASQSLIKTSLETQSSIGIVDLLLHASSHKSVHISGIALNILPHLIPRGSQINLNLFPILQKRASWPECFENDSIHPQLSRCIIEEYGVDFDEFESFRENTLSTALVSCYLLDCRLYLKSCSEIIHHICQSHSKSNWRQLEAALFSVNVAAVEICKNIAHTGSQPNDTEGYNATNQEESRFHNQMLSNCIAALSTSSDVCTCNPLTLAQMCRFIGKYSTWLATLDDSSMLDLAANMSLGIFETASTAFKGDVFAQDIIESMAKSPFTEAAIAIRCILSRSPNHFTSPKALAALAGGWDISYALSSNEETITIEDRGSLCSGICRVLAALSTDQWGVTLSSLAKPTIESLETVVDTIEKKNYHMNDLMYGKMIQRVGDEIFLLSVMIRTFNSSAGDAILDGMKTIPNEDSSNFEHPSLLVLHRAWPCVSFVSEKYSKEYVVAESLGQLLTQAIITASQMINPLPFLGQVSDVGINMIACISKNDGSSSLLPSFVFIEEVIEIYGSSSNSHHVGSDLSKLSMPISHELSQLIVTLLRVSSDAVSIVVGNVWTHGKEQGGGQNSVEGNSTVAKKNEKKSVDALSGMFSILTKCIKCNPGLLVTITPFSPNAPSLFAQSLEAAVVSINDRDIDATRQSILYLRAVIELRGSPEKLNPSFASEDAKSSANSTLSGYVSNIYSKLIERLLYGICGRFPREILDPSSLLLFSLLTRIPDQNDHQALLQKALNSENFILCKEALDMTKSVLSMCSNGTVTEDMLMAYVVDLWQIHESEDAASISGGDRIKAMQSRYCIES